MGSWGASRGVWSAGRGRFSSPSALPWGGPICSAVSSSGLPSSRKVRSYWEAVESPSLEIFQTLLDVVLCSLLWVTLLGQGVGLGDPQRSLPTPAMLGLCDSVTRARLAAITHPCVLQQPLGWVVPGPRGPSVAGRWSSCVRAWRGSLCQGDAVLHPSPLLLPPPRPQAPLRHRERRLLQSDGCQTQPVYRHQVGHGRPLARPPPQGGPSAVLPWLLLAGCCRQRGPGADGCPGDGVLGGFRDGRTRW